MSAFRRLPPSIGSPVRFGVGRDAGQQRWVEGGVHGLGRGVKRRADHGEARAAPLLSRRRHELTLCVAVIAALALLVTPLPTGLLDVLLVANLFGSLLVLMAALRQRGSLALSSLPTTLLLTTLFRLVLNVSSTRLILTQADAGQVIDFFGAYVVRDDYVVGLAIFAIISFSQFAVVARGAERVAEVGARFALDAIPGRQLSIDAEVRSGTLSSTGAQRSRQRLQSESDFYGAMDGAMKFVKGDALAALAITVVNLAVGLMLGARRYGWSLEQALQVYGLLTVGDGLVSQIPALMTAVAAGLAVTRSAGAARASGLAGDLASQLLGSAQTLGIAATAAGLAALLPGVPTMPFLVVAAAFALLARQRCLRQRGGARRLSLALSGSPASTADPALSTSYADMTRSAVGEEAEATPMTGPILELRVVAGVATEPDLRDSMARRQVAGRWRAVFAQQGLPGAHAVDIEWVMLRHDAETQLQVAMRGCRLASLFLQNGALLVRRAADSPTTARLGAVKAFGGALGMRWSWLQPSAQLPDTIRPSQVAPSINAQLALLAPAVARVYGSSTYTIDWVDAQLVHLAEEEGALVHAVQKRGIDTVDLVRVLRRLHRRGVDAMDLATTLDLIATLQPKKELLEATLRREWLRRQWDAQVVSSPTIALSFGREGEATLASAWQGGDSKTLALAPELAKELCTSVANCLDALHADDQRPVAYGDSTGPLQGRSESTLLVTTPALVEAAELLLTSKFPEVFVLGYDDLPAHLPVKLIYLEP